MNGYYSFATIGGRSYSLTAAKSGVNFSTTLNSPALNANQKNADFVAAGSTSLPTGTGNNVTVQSGATAVTYSNVSASGNTTIAPINPASAGQLPSGYLLSSNSVAVDISTTATVQPPIGICLAMPAGLDQATFSALRVLHRDNGALIDRTSSQNFASKTLARVSTSPFVVATSVPQLQFNTASYSVNEGSGFATITVNRLGETSGAASVDFATLDGTGTQYKDYTIAAGTVTFAPGEFNKIISVLVVDNLYVDGDRTLHINLANPLGAPLASPNSIVLTIQNNDSTPPTTNPLDNADAQFFVRQHYFDFLSRYPDPGGLGFWTGFDHSLRH